MKTIGAKKFLQEISKVDDKESILRVARKYRESDFKRLRKKLRKHYRIQEILFDKFPLHIHTRKEAEANQVIFYFHGGAYMIGPNSLHWSILDTLSKMASIDFALLDYPKAPEYTARTAMKVALEAYRYLDGIYGNDKITLMGDSAGGGLALSLAMELFLQRMPQPARLVLLSPWLDISLAHPQAREKNHNDVMLDCDGLAQCGRIYAGDLGVHHPWVSPRFGDVHGLPPTHIFVGGKEVFWPDIREFTDTAKEAGVDIQLNFEEEMPHVFPLFGMMPAGKKALYQIADLLRDTETK